MRITTLLHVVILLGAATLNAQTVSESFSYNPVGADLNGNSGGGSVGMSGSWVGDTSFDVGAGSLSDPTGTIAVK